MNAENLIIYNGSDWEAVEALDELLPQLESVSALALIVEAIDSVDGAALVITSE